MSTKDELANNKLKQFFVLHGEKVAFGFCILLVVVFFLLGRGVKSLEEGKTPSALVGRVVAANQHISRVNRQSWQEIDGARKPDFNLPAKVDIGREPIDYLSYTTYIGPPRKEPQALRSDPDLLPPSKPLLFAVYGALAVPPRADLKESQLDLLEYAEVEKEEKKSGRRSTTRDRSTDIYGGSGAGGYSVPFGGESYGAGGAESQPMADPGSGTKEYRQVTQSILQRLPGFKLQGSTAIPEAYTIVAGTATVPIRDQWLEYRSKFEDAIGFDAMRDRPIYMWYEVQRQDVTDRADGSVDPDAWKAIMFTGNYDEWYKVRYGAGPPPIVDLAYYEGATGRRYDYALTSPIPIILLRDVEQFALHPSTPKRKPPTRDETLETEEKDPMTDPRIGPTAPTAEGPTGPSSTSGAVTYSGGIYGSDYAGGSGSAEYGAMSATELVDFDPEKGPTAPVKLVRFFDINAKSGRKYRYRIRVALVDPNNPLEPQQGGTGATYGDSGSSQSYGSGQYGSSQYGSGPSSSAMPSSTGDSSSATVSLRWLEKSVRERVEQIQKADIAKHNARFVEWRLTDWSEPSDVVVVSQRGEQVLAGSVVAPKTTRIDENVEFAKEEPTGKLVVSEWVPRYAVDVPAETEVTLGTVLNFTSKADVLDPIKLVIKRIPEFQFKTDAIVLDMRGGQEMPGSDKDNMIVAPGEFLVIDADGQLRAQNELDDLEQFRLKLLMPDEEELEPQDVGIYGGETEPGDGSDFYGSGSTGTRSTRGRRRSGGSDSP